MIPILNFNISTTFLITILGMILSSISLLPLTYGGVTNKIAPEFRKKIDSAPTGSTWTVIIEFKKDETIFDSIYSYVENLKVPPGEKGMKSYESMIRLEKYAEQTQGKVIEAITNFQKTHPKLRQSTFWLSNDRGVWNAPKSLLYLLGEDEKPEFENITKIVESKAIPLEKSLPGQKPLKKPQEGHSRSFTPGEYEPLEETWGIARINARNWWRKNYNGSGVIIGHIDSGVDSRHPSLKWNWLGKGVGWLDPTSPEGREKNTFPYEATKETSHGTHTLGIAVGRGRMKAGVEKVEKEDDVEFFGVGVAPGARWISCLACLSESCDLNYVHECGKFMHCPDPKTNCQLAPDIVTVSNGLAQSINKSATKNGPYSKMVDAFKSVGIIPVFSAGNRGLDGCQSINEPADHEYVISVGNVDDEDVLHQTSGTGPPEWRYNDTEIRDRKIYKPDIVAPGTYVYSTVYTGQKAEFAYAYQSGTSMATPHVAGAIALLLSRSRELSFAKIREILFNNTKPNDRLSSTNANEECWGKKDTDRPNHKFGWGRLLLPDPDGVELKDIPENRPTRKMPPPPDYSTLEDNSTPPSIRPRMVGVVLMAGIAFLMNVVFEV